MNAVLVELKGALEELRKISSNIGAVTEYVKQISDLSSDREKEHMAFV